MSSRNSTRRGASTAVDTRRLAKALSYAGIDPRMWVSIGIVTSDGPVVDPEEGVFVDVLLLPSEVPETARLASIYAGPRCGVFFPIEKDDEVLVLAPSGDPNEGLVVLPRLWSPSDTPPSEIAARPNDAFWVLKQDSSGRFIAKGGGELVLQTDAQGFVRLGSEGAAQDAVRGTAYRAAEDALNAAQAALNAAYSAFFAAYAAGLGTPSPAIIGAATAVAAAQTAYSAAKATFDNAASTYLQPKVKVQ